MKTNICLIITLFCTIIVGCSSGVKRTAKNNVDSVNATIVDSTNNITEEDTLCEKQKVYAYSSYSGIVVGENMQYLNPTGKYVITGTDEYADINISNDTISLDGLKDFCVKFETYYKKKGTLHELWIRDIKNTNDEHRVLGTIGKYTDVYLSIYMECIGLCFGLPKGLVIDDDIPCIRELIYVFKDGKVIDDKFERGEL